MADFAPNPFSMVYSALWETLLRHPRIAKEISEGNRIRFDTDRRDPTKDSIQVADLPEMTLVASTGTTNLFDSSSTSKCVRQYSILIATGDLRYAAFLSQVEWMVFCALSGWKEVLGALRWKNQAFVKRSNIVSQAAGQRDQDMNRGIMGWSAVWTIEVEMHFATRDLQSELGCTGT